MYSTLTLHGNKVYSNPLFQGFNILYNKKKATQYQVDKYSFYLPSKEIKIQRSCAKTSHSLKRGVIAEVKEKKVLKVNNLCDGVF